MGNYIFYSFLSFVFFTSSCPSILPLSPSRKRSTIHAQQLFFILLLRPTIQVIKFIKYFNRGLPLLFFSSMHHVRAKFSNPSILNTCLENSNCHFLTVGNSFLSFPLTHTKIQFNSNFVYKKYIYIVKCTV